MIRKMKIEDVSEAIEIEKSIFSNPWSEKSFEDAIASKGMIKM